MKVLTVVGARPQFVKAAPVSKALREAGCAEYLVHTGQHYDYAMSQVFFDEMQLSLPACNLGIGSGSHGWQTGQMLASLEEVIQQQQPGRVLVYGDTNSTLAGALAAAKLQVPVAHVEAGLRSFNRAMPEELNRVLVDHLADLLFCPTETAMGHLAREGVVTGVHLVGDTMYDAVVQFADIANRHSTILTDLHLSGGDYYLATVHRPYNTDVPENLASIMAAFEQADCPVVFPVHPRTLGPLAKLGLHRETNGNLRFIDPVSYLDMLVLEQHAKAILTDSGGIQKEAYFFRIPCITLRPETEWPETVMTGWNQVTGPDSQRILAALRKPAPAGDQPTAFGDGYAAERLVKILTA